MRVKVAALILAAHSDITITAALLLEQATLTEVESTARQTLLNNAHHRHEHLRANMRVELKVLLDRKLGNLLEGLLHKALDLALFKLSLLSVDVCGMASSLSGVHALAGAHITIA